MKNKIKTFIFFFLFFFLNSTVYAASGSYTTPNASIYVGSSTDIYLSINTSGDIQALSGVVGVSDSSCIKINTVKFLVGDSNGYKFAYVSNNLVSSGTKIAKINVTGLKVCTARIIVNSPTVTSATTGDMSASVSTGTITVTEPPSGNNYLSNITLSQGSISFNKNTTSYSISVDSSVSSINIGATKEDSGAQISGTGTKNLNYGNNKFDIVVTAANGSKKIYTVNINRKDVRSSNNLLSSLSISNVEMNPKFSSGVDRYDISVPYSVSSLNIHATPADSKSKVAIYNNQLAAESVTEVKIVVTAENGSTKNYIIRAKRGKDPNKKLSTVKNLTNITVSKGALSPSFNKEQLKYIVYVPYEVDSIDIDVTLEDTKYGTVTKSGPNRLGVGNNEYKYTVTAEDESTQIYTVIVSRGISLTEQNLSNNNYLADIKINNGSIKEKFNKEIYVYHFTRNKNFEIEAISDEKNSEVNVIDNKDVINILVQAQTGDIRVYTLIEDKPNIINIILICLIPVSFTAGFMGYKIFVKDMTLNKKNKKDKK